MSPIDTERTKYLEAIILERKSRKRLIRRGLYSGLFKRKPASIWGGNSDIQAWWPLAAFVAVLFMIADAAFWFNSRGRPLPGGVFNLFAVFSLILLWPTITLIRRRRQIRRKRPTDEGVFVAGIELAAPMVPREFALAVRNSIASAYCIRSELIACTDTRRDVQAFLLIGQPFAVEIIAQVCRTLGCKFEHERMSLAAEFFKAHYPLTVGDIVQATYVQMSFAGLV